MINNLRRSDFLTLLGLCVGLLCSCWQSSLLFAGDLESIRSRHASLQNVVVDYELWESHTPDPRMLEVVTKFNEEADRRQAEREQNGNGARVPATRMSIDVGKKLVKGRFCFSAGLARYERRPGNEIFIDTFLKNRAEVFMKEGEGKVQHLRGIIDDKETRRLPDDHVIDNALGLRLYLSNQWLTSEDFKTLASDDDGMVLVRFVSGRESQTSHTWKLDPTHNFRLVSYEVRTDDELNRELIVQDFTKIDDIDFPKKILWRSFNRLDDGTRHQVLQTLVNVTSFQLNDKNNNEESMMIVWPANTNILDVRSGANLRVSAPDHALTDAMIKKAIDALKRPGQNDEEQ